MIVLALYLIGLGCVITGAVYMLGAGLVMVAKGVDASVGRLMQVGMSWLFAGSACNLPGVIDAWTNPNEKLLIQIFVGYAAFVVPLAFAFFLAGAVRRNRDGQRRPVVWLLASFMTWLSVGWAQTAQMFGLWAIAVFFR
jgi:uncharacterized membrane protein YhaH (DUF805 family)